MAQARFYRNGSIWPSLASATLYNLVMCLVLL